MKAISPGIVLPINESNNDRQDRFRHESYSHQSVYIQLTMSSDNLERTFDILQAYSEYMTIT